MPADFVVKVSQRYQKIYEMITNKKFNIEIKKEITKRIKDNLKRII